MIRCAALTDASGVAVAPPPTMDLDDKEVAEAREDAVRPETLEVRVALELREGPTVCDEFTSDAVGVPVTDLLRRVECEGALVREILDVAVDDLDAKEGDDVDDFFGVAVTFNETVGVRLVLVVLLYLVETDGERLAPALRDTVVVDVEVRVTVVVAVTDVITELDRDGTLVNDILELTDVLRDKEGEFD